MSTGGWVLVFALEALFLLWLLRWGGARLLEGTFASGCLIAWVTPTWDEEQIKLYALVALVASTIWFVLGLVRPELRIF